MAVFSGRLTRRDRSWRGGTTTLNRSERNKVLPLLSARHQLSEPAELWLEAGEIGFALLRRGATPKTVTFS
jgi:hypothetical protein